MKKFTFLLLSVTLLFSTNVFAQERGDIHYYFQGPTLTPDYIMETLGTYLDETSIALIDLFTYKKNSVTAVTIVYHTIDGNGVPTLASGVVFLPVVAPGTEVPVYSYLHGTLTKDADAPSYLEGLESIIGWIMSMDGYISVLPDYIGMGYGPGVHPYCHAETEASASIDMLKAASLLCMYPEVMAKPNGNLYLCGYSQGAHAALATQRELEKNPVPGLDLTLQKTVAGSGAYSLSFIQKNFLFNNPYYPNPSFLPYLILGYQEVYGNLYSNLSQVFKYPYNEKIPGLFDGSLNVEEIDSELPDEWQKMFVPRYLWNIRYNYFHPVNIDLRANDLVNWKPKTDLHLYYSIADELVAKENSMLAYLSFLLRGSRNVTCLPVGNLSHFETAPYVLLLAKIQFDCASGINPCGLNLPVLANITKSASKTDLSMFEEALNTSTTLDKDQILANKEIAAYFDIAPEKTALLNIYPNPATDVVFIEISDESIVNKKICVYDMQGRLVYNEIITNEIFKLNVNKFRNGVYKIVLNGDLNRTASLVINR